MAEQLSTAAGAGSQPNTGLPDAAAAIDREARAAASLRQSLAQLAEGDEDLMLDMIEGETSLVECIDALLLRMAADRALVEGTAKVVSDLQERARRVERRIAFRHSDLWRVHSERHDTLWYAPEVARWVQREWTGSYRRYGLPRYIGQREDWLISRLIEYRPAPG